MATSSRVKSLPDEDLWLDGLTNESTSIVFSADAWGRVAYVNHQWERITGWPQHEQGRRGWQQVLFREDRWRVLRSWRQTIKKCSCWQEEFRVSHANGHDIWLLARAIPVQTQDGSVTGYVGTAADITQIKQSDRERYEWYKRKRVPGSGTLKFGHRDTSILEQITDAFVSLDLNWRYTYVNKKAGKIFNRPPEDLIGKHIWTEFPEGVGQSFYHAYQKATREQRYIHLEEYYPPWDRWYENHIYPSEAGLSIFFQDVTKRKIAQRHQKILGQQLQRAQTTLQIQTKIQTRISRQR